MDFPPLVPGNRGRILSLLRAGPLTVNDLADALQLTDNGIRAHLETLQAEHLVTLAGERPGARKPHQLFALTPDARRYFPTADGPLLHYLLAALEGTMPPKKLIPFLKKIGAHLADAHSSDFIGASPEKRFAAALQILTDIGGSAELQQHEDRTIIQGRHCPLATLVPTHPEICAVAQGVLERILDHPVIECCTKSLTPCCRFEVPTP